MLGTTLSLQPSQPYQRALASLSVGIGNEGVLEGSVLHRALQVVVHTARLGEEALDASRCGRAAQPLVSETTRPVKKSVGTGASWRRGGARTWGR